MEIAPEHIGIFAYRFDIEMEDSKLTVRLLKKQKNH
jgi:hypothetical protein